MTTKTTEPPTPPLSSLSLLLRSSVCCKHTVKMLRLFAFFHFLFCFGFLVAFEGERESAREIHWRARAWSIVYYFVSVCAFCADNIEANERIKADYLRVVSFAFIIWFSSFTRLYSSSSIPHSFLYILTRHSIVLFIFDVLDPVHQEEKVWKVLFRWDKKVKKEKKKRNRRKGRWERERERKEKNNLSSLWRTVVQHLTHENVQVHSNIQRLQSPSWIRG